MNFSTWCNVSHIRCTLTVNHTFPPCSWVAGEREREMQVSKESTKAVINDFDNSKEYNFKVFTISGSQNSKPLLGTYKGNLSAYTMYLLIL